MTIHRTTEVVSRVLGFGDKVTVLEPPALREEVAGEAARTAAKYARVVASV